MNTREKVLKEALNCVNGEREKQYGNPEDNFRRIADLWSVYLTSLFEDEKIVVDIDPIDVAKMMILFKIARSNGDKDKLDNYIDILGYGACAAEIFENENKERVFIDEWAGRMKKFGGNGEGKEASDKISKKTEYTLCIKKDKPDEECNRKDCGQFDACITAYQHYIYNKTKEASEAIDKCMCEQVGKKDSASLLNIYNCISADILSFSNSANVDPFDVIGRLTIKGHAPTVMAELVLAGKLNLDSVVHYIKDAINEAKENKK